VKEKLLKLLKGKEEARAALVTKSNASEDVAEVRGINAQLQTIDAEIVELRGMIDAIPAETSKPEGHGEELKPIGELRTAGSSFNPMSALTGVKTQQRTVEPEDRYATIEYRKAFMEYCKTGQQVPELRSDAYTGTSDAAAVIPTTILNEIIKKVTSYGQVYARVRKLAIKGGLTVPILSLKPSATWIGEAADSDRQKVTANTNISFSYYGLECKVATSLLADTVTLPMFENTVIDLIVEAMTKALDLAIIAGDGSGKCLGITLDTRVPVGQIVTLAASDFVDWNGWKKNVFAKMPLGYKAGAVFLMASGTFEGYIDGMVDSNGQPIGRVNYGITDGPVLRFGGKEVIEVEDDVIANYDDASTGDVVAIYADLKNYAINSNMQMTMFRYLDHDTNQYIDKAILIMDGKLLDPNGVVIVKKGA
jgi:HK97 family phage major capsid protein